MGKPSLNPSFQRVRRAEEHLANLKSHIGALKTRQEQTVGCEFDPKPPHKLKLVDVTARAQPEMIVGIIIGEIVYNLRSAMDYLIYNLSWLDSGSPKDFTQFPIESRKKNFKGRKEGWLKGINAAHIAEIEMLQPYKGCNWARLLADLSNRDKHREFNRLFTEIIGTGVAASDPAFAQAAGHVRRAKHPIHGEMDVKLSLTTEIQFSDGHPVVEALEVVKLGVSDAVEFFKRDFSA